METEGLVHCRGSGPAELSGAEVEWIAGGGGSPALDVVAADGIESRATGVAGKTVRWVAQVGLTQVAY